MKSPEKCTNKLLKYIIQHSFRKLHLESIRCNVSDVKYAKLGNSFKFKFPQKNFLSFKGRFMCVCEGVQWGQMCVFVLLRVLHSPWQLPVRLKLICAISCLFAGCQHTHKRPAGPTHTAGNVSLSGHICSSAWKERRGHRQSPSFSCRTQHSSTASAFYLWPSLKLHSACSPKPLCASLFSLFYTLLTHTSIYLIIRGFVVNVQFVLLTQAKHQHLYFKVGSAFVVRFSYFKSKSRGPWLRNTAL